MLILEQTFTTKASENNKKQKQHSKITPMLIALES